MLIATSIIIPLACCSAIIQYYVEFVFIARISRYIVAIEYKINTQFKEHILFWESGIRQWEEDKNKNLSEEVRKNHKFLHIENFEIKRLLVLPLTLFIIGVLSAGFSFSYNILHWGATDTLLKVITVGIPILLFVGGIRVWYSIQKILDDADWNGQ